MREDGSAGDSVLEPVESVLPVLISLTVVVILGQEGHRPDDFGVSFAESSIEIGETEEASAVAQPFQRRPIGDRLDFREVHLDTFLADDDPEILDFSAAEFALFWSSVFRERAEDLFYLLAVLFLGDRIDEDIIEVRCRETVEERCDV